MSSPTLPDDLSAGRRQLTSWKEIAQFLGRSVRTVQEWEKRESLPVHRHRHQRKDSVYAYSDELESWWRQHADATADIREPAERPRYGWRWVKLSLGAAATLLLALTVPSATIHTTEIMAISMRTIDGPPRGSLTGAAIADLNGDQRADLVLHAHVARSVYVFFSGAALGSDRLRPETADVVIRGTRGMGLLAAQAGDFNADGLDDLLLTELLGEPDYYHKSGSSFIVLGRKQWPAAMATPADVDVTIRVTRAPDAAMNPCLQGPASDVNGDGIADIWLSALEYGDGDLKSAGALFVLHGRRAWPADLDIAASADLIVRGSRMGEGFGRPCAVDDTGRTVAVRAREDRLWNLLGGAGRLLVFDTDGPWPRTLAARDATWRIDGSKAAPLTEGFALGDVNGDHLVDLITGSPGSVQIWFDVAARKGVVAGAPDVQIHAPFDGRLGDRVRADDADGDGVDDLWLAEPGGRQLHLLYGRREWPRSGSLDTFGAVPMLRNGDAARWWEIAFGDLDSDLLPDLVVSAPEARDEAGRVWVLKPFIPVRLEVRPDDDPNPIIIPGGVCVARVYGWPGDRIAPDSVTLAGARPMRSVTQDFDGDGNLDWQFYFDAASLQVRRETTRIAVRGRTVSGFPIGGTDAIVVVSGSETERDQF